ncbi:MAG: GGDEF domain-containing protein [Rhodoferax sp.]
MPTSPGSPPTSKRHPADRRRRASDAGAPASAGSQAWFGTVVSFRMRRLEPLVALALAAYTVWAGVLLRPGTSVWWMALMAASVGGWSQILPARHPFVMVLRGALLLAGAFLLHAAVGATGPFFAWALWVPLFYALLFSSGWAAVLGALAVLEFAAACVWGPPVPSWPQALAQGGLLLTAVPLALVCARALRASDEQVETTLRDERTMLYNESGFFLHGAVLLADCHKAGRPFSMVLLNGADFGDIPDLLGRRAANDLFSQAVQAIAAIPGEGIAARIDALEFAVLLPGVAGERAAQLVKQRLGDPPKVEVQIHSKPVVIVMDMVVAQAKDPAETLEELYDRLHAHWAAKRARTAAAKKALQAGDERYSNEFANASPTVPLPLPPSPWR